MITQDTSNDGGIVLPGLGIFDEVVASLIRARQEDMGLPK